MDKIKQINSIFKIARSQLSKQTKPGSLHSDKQARTTDGKTTGKISSGDLKKSISKKLKLLDRKSRNYEQLSNGVFLESVLLWEFGDDIINDGIICNDKESSRKFSRLIKQLADD